MESLKKANMSIGDFAMNLIQENKKGKTVKQLVLENIPAKADPGSPDLTKVNVSEDKMDQILKESFGVQASVQKETPKIQESVPSKNNERKPEDILKEFAEVVAKGKQLIHEMTTCGMLGVNLGQPRPGAIKTGKKKKKRKVIEGNSTGFFPKETGERIGSYMKKLSPEERAAKNDKLRRVNAKVANRPFVQPNPGEERQKAVNKRFSMLKKALDAKLKG